MAAALKWHVGAIHATPLSIPPLTRALEAELPDARVRHLLDSALLADLNEAGALTDALRDRMERLVAELLDGGVGAVQLACSGFAPVVDDLRTRQTTPILKPDEAMYRALVEAGYDRVGVLATVQPALDLATRQVAGLPGASGRAPAIVSRCVPAALDAASRGDRGAVERLLAAAAAELAGEGAEAIALAQYSMSAADGAVADATGVPVYTGPGAAARMLREVLAA